MASIYNIDELELNSQVQLLSRIQFLTRFSSSLLQVSANDGAGKTWLSECYLEKWANEPTQALLLCNQNQSDEQHRAVILRQLVQEGAFDPVEPLVNSLSSMLQEEAIHALILIDDADMLSATIAKELWQLICVAQERVGWQINVILFSKPSKLEKVLQKAAKAHSEKPVELDVPPLTDNEREQLITAIIQSFGMDGTARRAFKMRAQDVPSYPGSIIDCAYPKISSKPKASRSLFIPITVAILLSVLAATLIFWLQIPKGMSPGQYLTQIWDNFSKEVEVVETPKIDINALAQEDNIALPELPQGNDMSVGSSQNSGTHSVVVDAELIDAMLDKEDQQLGLQDLEDTLDFSEFSPESSNAIAFANQALLNVPSSRYALQLGAFQTEQDLQEFIEQYDLRGRVLVYETLRSGTPWYMVLLGDYPSVSDARRTELELSDSLRSLKPWAKSFTQIHKEISLMQ